MFARNLPTLARLYLLGMFLSILPGSQAQVRLVETGGKVTHEGQSVTLTCKASGFNFKEYSMSWHWSSTESLRELVASINWYTGNYKEYNPRIKGRASIERDNVNKIVSLTLSPLQKEDSGTYYCARRQDWKAQQYNLQNIWSKNLQQVGVGCLWESGTTHSQIYFCPFCLHKSIRGMFLTLG